MLIYCFANIFFFFVLSFHGTRIDNYQVHLECIENTQLVGQVRHWVNNDLVCKTICYAILLMIVIITICTIILIVFLFLLSRSISS